MPVAIVGENNNALDLVETVGTSPRDLDRKVDLGGGQFGERGLPAGGDHCRQEPAAAAGLGVEFVAASRP